jgi:hypothetical protein
MHAYISFPAALRPDSVSWPLITGLHGHTHKTNHNRYASSGREISPTQRPLPDNTQHSQETDFHAPVGVRTHNTQRMQSFALARPLGLAHTYTHDLNMPINITTT